MFTSDDYGLKVEIDPPMTQAGKDVVELVSKGYIGAAGQGGFSFGMFPQDWEDLPDGTRRYTSAIIDEITITAVPAFPQTSIGLKMQPAPTRTAHALKIAQLDLEIWDVG